MSGQKSVELILAQRGGTHGSFSEQFRLSQELKRILATGPRYGQLTPAMREAAEMVLMKLSRAVCGDPFHEDHWADIAGYATLISQSLRRDASWRQPEIDP